MIDGIIGGRIYGKPAKRTSQNGNPFVVAKVRAAGGDGEALFVNVITFTDSVGEALLALDDGDSVSLSGTLTPKVWIPPQGEPRASLDMVAHAVMTAYHVQRKRKAVAGNEPPPPAPTQGDLVSDLPWK